MATLLQIFFRSLESGGFYALAALGIIIIFRTSVMTNFAQGSLGMFSAFIAASFLIRFTNNPILGAVYKFLFGKATAPVWFAAILGIVSALILGILIDLLVIRRARKVNPVSKQIITLGLIMLLAGFAPLIFGNTFISFPRFIPEGQFNIAGATLTYNGFLNIVIGIIIMAALFYFLQKTKWGLAVRVTASNEPTARLMGVPTKTVTMGAWALAAALGTLSALMVAPGGAVSVGMMESVQIIALIACVLGGFQTFYGPVVGAYIIGFTRNILLVYVSSQWGEQLVYIAILLFIIVRPYGLFGKKIVKKV